jgi:hypothetical protein
MGLKLGVPNDSPFYTPHPPLFATTNGSIVRPVLNSLEKKRKTWNFEKQHLSRPG